jgi:hypothetical protein
MAKKKAAEKSDAVLTLPVKYGKVSIGESVASIPITVQLSDLSLNTAYQKLCGKRIIGNIMARSGGAQAKQESLPGLPDADLELSGAFDIKAFSFNKKKISTTISFSLESIDIETLAHFAKREGVLTALGIEEIPDGKGDDDEDDDD